MAPVRILHTADIHLDSPLVGLAARAGERADELVGATRKAFRALVDYAIESDVALLLIAGDLYDGDWRDFSTGLFFMKEMARLEKAGIRVAIVFGNHDAESNMTRSLRPIGNMKIFSSNRPETWTLEELDIAIHGRSFPKRDVADNYAVTYPDKLPGLLNIGLLHTAADGTLGHERYAPCELKQLVAKDYDYWALGHVHKRVVLNERPWVVFPGNLQGRHANETGIKGATLVTVDDGDITAVEHVPFDVVRWAQVPVDVTGCADYDQALDRVGERIAAAVDEAGGRTLAVRVTLDGTTSAHRQLAGDIERTKAECEALAERSGGDVWFERIEVCTSEPGQAAAGDADALEELLRVVDEIRGDPEEMASVKAELTQALSRMPDKVRAQGGFKELDDATLGAALEGAAATLRHRFLDRG